MLQIPILAVPSQQVNCVLAEQNCQIAVYVKNQAMFFDLNSDGLDISLATICRNIIPLNPINYTGFEGNFIFIDTQGSDDPIYTGLGSRFFLIYLTAAEFAAYRLPNDAPPSPPNLLTTDDGIIIYTNSGDVIEVILS